MTDLALYEAIRNRVHPLVYNSSVPKCVHTAMSHSKKPTDGLELPLRDVVLTGGLPPPD